MDTKVTIPVKATMQKQPDGSYKMVNAEYVTVEADVIARFLVIAFRISPEKAKAQGDICT